MIVQSGEGLDHAASSILARDMRLYSRAGACRPAQEKPPSIVTEYRQSDDEVKLRVRRVSLAELDRRSGEVQAISLVTWIPASFVAGPSGCISLSIEPMSPRYENWRRFWYMTDPMRRYIAKVKEMTSHTGPWNTAMRR